MNQSISRIVRVTNELLCIGDSDNSPIIARYKAFYRRMSPPKMSHPPRGVTVVEGGRRFIWISASVGGFAELYSRRMGFLIVSGKQLIGFIDAAADTRQLTYGRRLTASQSSDPHNVV